MTWNGLQLMWQRLKAMRGDKEGVNEMTEMTRYWISWKNKGDEHFCEDITWCGGFYTNGLQEALISLFDFEKSSHNEVTEITWIGTE